MTAAGSVSSIRRTLLSESSLHHWHPDHLHFAEDFYPHEDEGTEAKGKCRCASKLRSVFLNRLQVLSDLSAENLKIGAGPSAGLWDRWGLYYCSNRYGKAEAMNDRYFYIACGFLIGQGGLMLDLVNYMSKHGGAAFLIVLLLTYLSLGYPLYLVETMMGQYSGRKPLQMLRLLMPAFTGLGPALYLRTIAKTVVHLATFFQCGHMAFSLFFCRTENNLVYRYLETEGRNPKFFVFGENVSQAQARTKEHFVYHWYWFTVVPIILLALVVQNIKLIGELANILVRVLILGVAGYVIVGFSRISKASSTSIVWFPLQRTLQPNWKALISGRAWVDAMLFVIQSMELGTLVHPYLGSKNFFHYRCHRDGLYLVLIAFLWNLGASVASLTWLGYVGVNRVQMEAARRLLHGQYGLTLVYELKHVQGEMTQNVQGDCLFFLAVFYSMVGIAALFSVVIYLIIIVDSSYPESGQWVMKVLTALFIVFSIGLLVPYMTLQAEGLRRTIFINFYTNKTWSPLFVVGCYFCAVAWGHDLGKFVHDFLNIVHIQGFQSKHHSYHVPRILRYFVLTFLLFGTIHKIFQVPYPQEGQTDWSLPINYIVGMTLTAVPLLALVTTFNYYRAVFKASAYRPHRDWFKNKHHRNVCFADFTGFKGIPTLQDPEMSQHSLNNNKWQ